MRWQFGMTAAWTWGRRTAASAALLVLLLTAAACSGSGAAGRQPAATPSAPSAPATSSQTLTIPGSDGQTAQGIPCQATEQLAYHIHAHLTLIVDGQNVLIPAGIGIAPPREAQQGFVVGGKCFYWLHTHDVSGVVHIESPTAQLYTLGQFFAVWGQPLSASQVATFTVDASHPLNAFVNGQPYQGAPDQIQLDAHELITLEIGQQVPPPGFNFPPGL
jgi:hypothetical protein